MIDIGVLFIIIDPY